MNRNLRSVSICAVTIGLFFGICNVSHAAVSAAEAAQLKGDVLTPLGSERAANKDGSIPAWTGGISPSGAPIGKGGGRRTNPFEAEKALFSVNVQNAAQYADKLSDGYKAMLKKYPNFRMDVYKTHRTASAPQWVVDNIFKNATRAKFAADGYSLEGAYGGIPFPIPKTGQEAMWNHFLAFRHESLSYDFTSYITTGDGQRILANDITLENQYPYYNKNGSLEKFNGNFHRYRLQVHGPAQHNGEALILTETLDQTGGGRQVYSYLVGQRRVRKLPNAAYDTPSFVLSGVSNFDEINVFEGPLDRYDWKLVGKKEMFIPYNTNAMFIPTKDSEVHAERFLNPDHMRWELHRVWVVEATLKSGKRHVLPKRTFYLDEDTWMAVMADGWDAKGQLSKTFWRLLVAAPELPGLVPSMFGHYNLQTGDWVSNVVMNEKSTQMKPVPPFPDSRFSPDSLAGEGVR